MWRLELHDNAGAGTVRAALDPQYFADEVKLGRDSFQEAGRLGSQVSREHLMVRATGRGTLRCTQIGSNKSFVQRARSATLEPLAKGESVDLAAGDRVFLCHEKGHDSPSYPVLLRLGSYRQHFDLHSLTDEQKQEAFEKLKADAPAGLDAGFEGKPAGEDDSLYFMLSRSPTDCAEALERVEAAAAQDAPIVEGVQVARAKLLFMSSLLRERAGLAGGAAAPPPAAPPPAAPPPAIAPPAIAPAPAAPPAAAPAPAASRKRAAWPVESAVECAPRA